jgi:hypothetical protein
MAVIRNPAPSANGDRASGFVDFCSLDNSEFNPLRHCVQSELPSGVPVGSLIAVHFFGVFPSSHARYLLRSKVRVVAEPEAA